MTVEGTALTIGPDGATVSTNLDAQVGELLTVTFSNLGHALDTTGTAEVVSNTDGLLKLRFTVDSAELRTELGDIVVAESRARFARKTSGHGHDLVF